MVTSVAQREVLFRTVAAYRKAPHSTCIGLGPLQDRVHPLGHSNLESQDRLSRMAPEMVRLISVDSWSAALPKLLLSKAILVSTLTSEWAAQPTKYPLRPTKNEFR